MSKTSEITPSSKRRRYSSSKYSGDIHEKTSAKSPISPSSDEQKSRFQRLFSEEDEIHLLKAILDYSKTAGASPSPTNIAASLFDRMKNCLTGDFSRLQLSDKIRKLRLKYNKQVNNETFIKTPHERDVFELNHQIWSEDFTQQKQKDTNGSAKDPQSDDSVKEKVNSKSVAETSPTENGVEVVVLPELDLEDFPFLMEEMSCFPGNAVLKEGLRSLDAKVLKRLNEQWRLHQIAEAELMAKRAELIHEHIKLILGAVPPLSLN